MPVINLQTISWPIITSHCLCLLSGFAIANFLNQKAKPIDLRLPPKTVLFAIHNQYIMGNDPPKERLFLVRPRNQAEKLYCRLHERAIGVYAYDAENIIFNSHVSQIAYLLGTLQSYRALQRARLHWLAKSEAEKLPLCVKQGRVIYEG